MNGVDYFLEHILTDMLSERFTEHGELTGIAMWIIEEDGG